MIDRPVEVLWDQSANELVTWAMTAIVLLSIRRNESVVDTCSRVTIALNDNEQAFNDLKAQIQEWNG